MPLPQQPQRVRPGYSASPAPDWIDTATRLSPWSQASVVVAGLGASGFAAADGLMSLGAGRILVLDECTSALDAANQAAVMDTLRHAAVGRTALVVTHKLPMMRMCDRILVLHGGAVAEQGTYEELMERRGVFAQLARGGEWMSE